MAKNDVVRVSAPNTTKAEKARLKKLADAKRERDRPRLQRLERSTTPTYREVWPIVTGLGRAGTGIMKALDLPNRVFGNTRSRLQDLYERADRNIELTKKRNPSTLDRTIESVGTLAGLGWAGRALPLLFGASAGTEVVDAAERSGASNPAVRGARAAAVDTGIWSAAINLGSKALPSHLEWLGPYIAGIAKSVVSTVARSAEYKDMGYDVSVGRNVAESAKLAALIPVALGGVREIAASSYKVPGTGRTVSNSEFANKFQQRIKQSDRTAADAERIANEYIDMVERDPGSFVQKVSPAGKALQKFTGLLVQPFKNGQTSGRARMVDPNGDTGADAEAWANDDVRSWYQLYEKTLSGDEIRTLRDLTGKDKLTADEKRTMTELITRPTRSDVHVTGTDPHTGQYVDQTIGGFLSGLAEADSAARADTIGTLASFLKTADHYSPTEKALVLQAAATYGVRTGKNGSKQLVSMDSTNTQQPTVVDDAMVSTIVAGLRDGVPIKKAMLAEPKASAAVGKRGVPANYTGWKKFDKSNKPEDIAALQAACAGSRGRWCTGEGAAGSQLPYGDFHVHFTDGEPDVAIRMTGSTVNEVRGSDTGQRLFPREAMIAEDYIREQQASGYHMTIDKGFWADQAFRRKLATDSVEWRDVWNINPKKPSFAGAAGEMGAENSWPPYAKKVIEDVLNTSRKERHDSGYFLLHEVPEGSSHPEVRHLKSTESISIGYPERFPNLESTSSEISIILLDEVTSPKTLRKIGGSLTLYKGASAPNVTSVGGDLNLEKGASAPNVTSVGGNLDLKEGTSAPNVTSVGWSLRLYENASAPNVTSVGGILKLYEGASAPNVTSVGRDLFLSKGTSAPNVTSVGGDLNLGISASAPNVTSVGGDLNLEKGASAPNVTSVGRDLFLSKGTSAPNVTSVGGDLNLEKGASAPNVTSVGGILKLYEGASVPALTSIGWLHESQQKLFPKIIPKYGYTVGDGGYPDFSTLDLGFLDNQDTPEFVRRIREVNLHNLSRFDLTQIFDDKAKGFPDTEDTRQYYNDIYEALKYEVFKPRSQNPGLPEPTDTDGDLDVLQMAAKGGNTRSESKETFDTPIPDDLRPAYDAWYKQLPKNLQYTGDYDLQGAWLERLGRPTKYEATQNGHLDDYGKKPNHPTFSSGSKWHDPKIPERTGGEWKKAADGSWDFYPGSGNVLTDEQLKDYFDKYEKGSRVHPRNIRQAAKAGDAGPSSSSGVPSGHNTGPRIVVNPSVFHDEKDALCVAFNEAFRVIMEMNGFDPVAEPTEKQRKFFADTAYADDENMMRRTILARICTFDTSVTDPTDEQLQEAVEFLDTVMEIGAPQNEWEQRSVQRIRDAVAASVGQPRAEEAGEPGGPSEGPENAAAGGGKTDKNGTPELGQGVKSGMMDRTRELTGAEAQYMLNRYTSGASMSNSQRQMVGKFLAGRTAKVEQPPPPGPVTANTASAVNTVVNTGTTMTNVEETHDVGENEDEDSESSFPQPPPIREEQVRG